LQLAAELDMTFKILNAIPVYGDDGCTLMLEFHATPEQMIYITDFFTKTEKFTLISNEKIGKDTYIVMFTESKSCGCEALSSSGCFLSTCEFTPGGALINIITGPNGSLYAFMSKLEEKGFKLVIKLKRGCNQGLEDLTDRQREVVQLAYSRGYFDVPKQISLKELSDEVGVSPSSVDEILKRAEKKILSHYFMR
jgi:predicted DNA binding protein